MQTMKCALLALGLLGLGCRFPSEPRFGTVTGVVRYPDQTPVFRARVSIAGERSTFTDVLGRYRLELSAPHDTLSVLARGGFTPGRGYGGTPWGGAREGRLPPGGGLRGAPLGGGPRGRAWGRRGAERRARPRRADLSGDRGDRFKHPNRGWGSWACLPVPPPPDRTPPSRSVPRA